MAASPQISSTEPDTAPAAITHPTKPPSCVACKSTTKKVWTCVQCGHFNFCDDCWGNERPHKPGVKGIDGRPHEKTDIDVVERLNHIFHNKRKEDLDWLFADDAKTKWFGVDKGSNGLIFTYTDRLTSIMVKTADLDASAARFPLLVSFVGRTGGGKSTILQMLVRQQQALASPGSSFSAPVIGLTDDPLPTSADVNLYPDPTTHHTRYPVLFADCEGLGGGESVPHAKQYQRDASVTERAVEQKLQWAMNVRTPSRNHTARTLFPRILHTFSDVVVFVMQEAKRAETNALVDVVQWASFSIEQSTSPRVLPHLIIALNRTDNPEDQEWGPETATESFHGACEDITQVPELAAITEGLARHGKSIKSSRDLLACFYRTVTVIRVPTKDRYMQLDHQIGELYHHIQQKSAESYVMKNSAGMALSSNRLHLLTRSALGHFAEDLDQPFDFKLSI
ncbi:hypothetical protein QBC41DRAFT_281679 [Cercophora samala]|uniref:ZZ-type domain-containing protein n=1 Tax=Cercophora samala TaxID=330535 RepID=A0AA39Z8J3_9PEZI|nr:hypothetical protein QBC41DRAFT_281679 [Cercophora samala]